MNDFSKRPEHGMIPGSHEGGRGAECHCGAEWSRWSDMCAAQFKARTAK